MNENTIYDYSPDSPYALRPIDEDIFGTTRLYQPPLSEPLYECRLGWYYSPSRTTSKRTGQPLKKKPSYRYDKKQLPITLGRIPSESVYQNVELKSTLDSVLNYNRDYTVFIPQELWSQYPNAQSLTSPSTTIIGTGQFITNEPEINELGTVTVDLNSPVYSPITVSPCTPGVTKPTLWKRFLNWLSLEY